MEGADDDEGGLTVRLTRLWLASTFHCGGVNTPLIKRPTCCIMPSIMTEPQRRASHLSSPLLKTKRLANTKERYPCTRRE